ncbi:hypothetical protein, partial [Peribacillus simplex]|uniref:hypothetical protein n=1 Tax=Peribacillus simplex TaxID=1478 RepID=UPI001C8753E7
LIYYINKKLSDKNHSVDLKLLPDQNSYNFQKSSVKAFFLVKGLIPLRKPFLSAPMMPVLSTLSEI